MDEIDYSLQILKILWFTSLIVNKRNDILILATTHIDHLCNQFNYVFALLISMPRFKSIYFYPNTPKLSNFLKKYKNCRTLGASSPDPRNSSRVADF